jgi:hypothetical protein
MQHRYVIRILISEAALKPLCLVKQTLIEQGLFALCSTAAAAAHAQGNLFTYISVFISESLALKLIRKMDVSTSNKCSHFVRSYRYRWRMGTFLPAASIRNSRCLSRALSCLICSLSSFSTSCSGSSL